MADSIKDNIKEDDGQKIRELVAQMKLYNNPQELEDMKKLMKTRRGAQSAMSSWESTGSMSAVQAPVFDSIAQYLM